MPPPPCKNPVAKFIVPDWGIKLAPAQGCRTGPPAYVHLYSRRGAGTQPMPESTLSTKSGTMNLITAHQKLCGTYITGPARRYSKILPVFRKFQWSEQWLKIKVQGLKNLHIITFAFYHTSFCNTAVFRIDFYTNESYWFESNYKISTNWKQGNHLQQFDCFSFFITNQICSPNTPNPSKQTKSCLELNKFLFCVVTLHRSKNVGKVFIRQN